MKKILFPFCLFMIFVHHLNGQQLNDSIDLQEKMAFNKRIIEYARRDSLLSINPQILIEIRKNGDIFFEGNLVSTKKLSKQIKDKIENIVWQNDVRIATVSAEVGTKFTYVTNMMKVLNKYKIRILLKTN